MKKIVFIFLGASLLVIALTAFLSQRKADVDTAEIVIPVAATATPVVQVSTNPQATVPVSAPVRYTGQVLAGQASPLLDFTKQDYDVALASNKLIVLYFYADWCPICRKEFPVMQAAFHELAFSDVVGFRVNFNDHFTDEFEKSLAQEHGVAYQHTKVFVKGGQRILKSPETWEKSDYISQIGSAR